MHSITTDDRPHGGDFARQAEPLRRELLAYCYRMLGSVDDAEEVVQEVYLDAWRAYDAFEGRSSLRTWLYRIATRACLKAAERGRRRPLPSSLVAASDNPYAELDFGSTDLPWLQPMPDAMFVAEPADPAAIVIARSTMRLALIAALQQLPPRQRAVLILRDVLEWRAAEVATLLDMTVAAVNSALQRARSELPLREENLEEPAEPQRLAMLDRYVAAFEEADIDGLIAVLTDDVSLEMPPIRTWFAGRGAVAAFLAPRMRAYGPTSFVAASANGQPALGHYVRDSDGLYRPHALHVLTVVATGISRIVLFQHPGPDLLARFGLAPEGRLKIAESVTAPVPRGRPHSTFRRAPHVPVPPKAPTCRA
jgi:RNA polymerase sigma-70 factor (ECF subfamily)